MRPIQKTLAFAGADAVGVSLLATPAANTVLVDGTFASGGVATLYTPAELTLISTSNFSATTFTITGTDENGLPYSEAIAGPNNNTVTTTGEFSTVTSITYDTGTFTVETLSVGVTAAGLGDGDWWPLDIYTPNQVTTISVNIVSGTAVYSVQYTNEDPFDTDITQLAVAHPATGGAFTSANSDQTHSTTTLMRAVRVNIASGAGTIRATVVQQSTA